MAVSKVQLGAETLIDLTGDTVTAADVRSGKTAHDRSGAGITGTLTVPVIQTDRAAVTPGASSIQVYPTNGADGMDHVVVNGDTDLIAANIKDGVNIFDVFGSFSEYAHHTTGTFTGNNKKNWTLTLDASTFVPKLVYVRLNAQLSSNSSSIYYYTDVFKIWDSDYSLPPVNHFMSLASGNARIGNSTANGWTRSGTSLSFSITSIDLRFGAASYRYDIWG